MQKALRAAAGAALEGGVAAAVEALAGIWDVYGLGLGFRLRVWTGQDQGLRIPPWRV